MANRVWRDTDHAAPAGLPGKKASAHHETGAGKQIELLELLS
jgi:hypothetical protein